MFPNNLRYLRIRDRLSQVDLSKKMNISDKTISSWEIGRTEPNIEQLSKLCKIFSINLNDFLNVDLSTSNKEKVLSKFKLYDNPVSAGLGSWLDEGTEYCYSEIEHPTINADFALKVRGDSMAPMYNDGDIVFVKSLKLIEPGEVGVFLINNDGFLKQWKGNRLESLNKKYDPITISENDTFMIIGKVVDKLNK